MVVARPSAEEWHVYDLDEWRLADLNRIKVAGAFN